MVKDLAQTNRGGNKVERAHNNGKAIMEIIQILILMMIIGPVVAVPLALIINRTTYIREPNRFLKALYYGGRRPNQCTLCEKHPTSKNYHIKNVHKLKNVDVKSYFKDCGCNKCADYNKN